MIKFLKKVSFVYMADTPWCGSSDVKLYLQSGQFTSTIKDSEDVNGVDVAPTGISYDGTNSPWCGIGGSKLYLQSGQFTSTIKDSENISGIESNINGISWDGNDTPWIGYGDDKLYLQSAQFTSTIKTSQYIGGVDNSPSGISYDNINTPWTGDQTIKLYLQSGQFTSTLKTSYNVSSIDIAPADISWDGTNTPWIGNTDDKLYLQSGQFTSTVKDSESIGGIESAPRGICTNDYTSRISGAPQIYEESVSNTVTFGQLVSQVGSIFNRSVTNTISFNQIISQSGSIFNRSISNTITLNQIISIYTINNVSIITTVSLTQDVVATRIQPVGTIYNITLANTLVLNHYVDYTWVKFTGETYHGRIVHTIQNLSQQILVNGIYNRSLENTIVFTHSLPKEDITEYLLDIPRWIKASTSRYFSQVAIDNDLHYYVEGTHRETNEQQTYIEFRLDGPSMTQISKDYYRFDVNINILWSNQQDRDFYKSEHIKGILLNAMSDICIYKYGNNTYDDNSHIGVLEQKTTQINNFGQVRSDARLIQGTVEGVYTLIIYLPSLEDTSILPINLNIESKINNIPQFITASVNKHFNDIALSNNLHLFVEGTHRETKNYQKSIELRLNGPHTTEISKNYFRLDIEINVLWSFHQNDTDFHEPERLQGILLRAMREICVRKYGDDGSFLGTLQLKQEPIQVDNFGQVRTDVKLMQGTVEGTYIMYFLAN